MQTCRICGRKVTKFVEIKSKYKEKIYSYIKCNLCNRKLVKKYRETEVGWENYKKQAKIQYQRGKEKAKARNAINYLIYKGVLKKPDICTNCLSIGMKLEAHHSDYSKPLQVLWLCRQCHVVIHKK